jgi:Ca2+:H+ antiporter
MAAMAGRRFANAEPSTVFQAGLQPVGASIGVTIPAVAVVSIVLGQPLELGLDRKDMVLLARTVLVNVITLGIGRTTVLQGIVHLVIFAAFLFFSIVP